MTTFISMISEVSTATLSNIATAIGMPVAILVFGALSRRRGKIASAVRMTIWTNATENFC